MSACRRAEYDDFVESFIEAVCERWPFVLLQWEDFARSNAGPLLARYRDRLCTFNDDIQGTAAVAAGTLLAAISVTGIPLTGQRIALLGAGSAGGGIASLLIAAMVEAGISAIAEARSRFYAVERNGLILERHARSERLAAPARRCRAQPWPGGNCAIRTSSACSMSSKTPGPPR